MENKPVFCSECGAKLTGSAAFCSACGAKQEFAPAAVVQTPAPAAEPVVEAAPVVETPAAAPENSLAAPKAKMSVFGLLLAIAAICLSLTASLASFLYELYNATHGFHFDVARTAAMFLRRGGYLLGTLTGIVLPLMAMVMVLIKKKPAAIIGLVVVALVIVMQVVVASAYKGINMGRVNLFKYVRIRPMTLFNLFNGEGLFVNMQRLHLSSWPAMQLVRLGVDLMFYLKNILALGACLVATLKKK